MAAASDARVDQAMVDGRERSVFGSLSRRNAISQLKWSDEKSIKSMVSANKNIRTRTKKRDLEAASD